MRKCQVCSGIPTEKHLPAEHPSLFDCHLGRWGGAQSTHFHWTFHTDYANLASKGNPYPFNTMMTILNLRHWRPWVRSKVGEASFWLAGSTGDPPVVSGDSPETLSPTFNHTRRPSCGFCATPRRQNRSFLVTVTSVKVPAESKETTAD